MAGPPKPPPGSKPGPTPPPPPGSERRKHERFDVIAQVEIKRSNEVWLVPVVNISAGGVLVEFDDEVPELRAGDAAQVFLDLGAMMSVNVDAEVVRMQGGAGKKARAAFMWTAADPNVTRKLASILDRMCR